MNPYAAFDALQIIASLQSTFRNVAEAEVHLFAYLSCLLSLYSGQPVGDWGYDFAGTTTGSPYSFDLQNAMSAFVANGLVVKDGGFHTISENGRNELKVFSTLAQNVRRSQYLSAAESTTLVLPIGLIRDAIFYEPTLRPATQLKRSRLLLSEPLLSVLYEQFELLREAVPSGTDDLFVPSTVWLSYMAKGAALAQDAAGESL